MTLFLNRDKFSHLLGSLLGRELGLDAFEAILQGTLLIGFGYKFIGEEA